MGQTKETIPNIGPKERVSLIKATVIIVALAIHPRNVQHTAKSVIHVTKRGILSLIVDHQDNEAKAKVENGGLTQPNPDNPGMTSMKLLHTETKVTTQTGFSLNRTQCKYYFIVVYALTLTPSLTFSLMKLKVKEFNLCLLT